MKVVSERLGHANAAFTTSVYQHVLPGMQAEAAAAFAQVLRNVRRTTDAPRASQDDAETPTAEVSPSRRT